MSNTVSQPTAQALKLAGWEWETEATYSPGKQLYHVGWSKNDYRHWLPAPNLSELRERLTLKDFHAYWKVVSTTKAIVTDWEFAVWLYDVTASADALATIWIWKEKP